MTGPDPLLVDKDWYDGLPADLRSIFDEVAVEALALNDELAQKAEMVLLDKLGAHMEVNFLDDAGIATFKDAVQPVYQDGINAGHFTKADIDKALAAAKSCG